MVEDEPQYDVILKMVLWGEDREAIYHRLKVNGIEGDRADKIYQRAWTERMRSIRGEGLKALLIGLGSIGLAVGIFYFFKLDELDVEEFGDGVNGVPFLPWLLGFAAAILGFIGIWKSAQGSFEILFAASKKGSIGND